MEEPLKVYNTAVEAFLEVIGESGSLLFYSILPLARNVMVS